MVAANNTYRLEGKKILKVTGQHYQVRTDSSLPADAAAIRRTGQSRAPTSTSTRAKRAWRAMPTSTCWGIRWSLCRHALFPADSSRQTGFFKPARRILGAARRAVSATVLLGDRQEFGCHRRNRRRNHNARGAFDEYRLQNGLDNYFRVDTAYVNERLRSRPRASTTSSTIRLPTRTFRSIVTTLSEWCASISTPIWSLTASAISVSDSLYLREMNIWTLSKGFGNGYNTMTDAPAHFGLIDSFEDGYAKFGGTWNQDLIQPQEFALQRLPEFLFSGRRELLGGLAYADYDVEADNFWRSSGVSGLRLDLNPQLTVPWRLGQYVFGWGGVGTHETVYDVSGHQIAVIPVGTEGLEWNNGLKLGPLASGGLSSRELPYANFGAQTILEEGLPRRLEFDRQAQAHPRAVRLLQLRAEHRPEPVPDLRSDRSHQCAQPF